MIKEQKQLDDLLDIKNEEIEHKEIKHSEIKTNNNRLAGTNSEVYFSEDIWNLNKKGTVKFEGIHYIYKDYIKDEIYKLYMNDYSKRSIEMYLGIYKKIVTFLINNAAIDDTLLMNDIGIKFNEYLDKKLTSETSKSKYRRGFRMLIENIETKKDIDYRELKNALKINNNKVIKAQAEQGKTPNIPSDILDKIIMVAIKEINDVDISDEEKIEACCVLLISQVGMRIGELALVEANKLSSVTIHKDEKVSYIDMFALKEEKFISKTRTTSFMTDKAVLAYKTLEKITSEYRKENGSDYFFMNKDMTDEKSATANVRLKMNNFFIRNCIEIGLLNKEFEGFKVEKFSTEEGRRLYNKHNKAKQRLPKRGTFHISMPKAHQFRVAVCNELLKQGVDISWVMQHMNHLTAEMTSHYARNEQEERDAADKLLEDLIKGEYRLIGDEAKELIESINEFLEENEFNVEKDLEEIIKKLKHKFPIREKKEGFCIKSSFGKACKRNEFYCAFDMCNNFCTSYLFTDIAYKRFQDIKRTIKYNEECGFEKEVEIEKKKIKQLVNNRLIPELKEVEYEINRQGLEVLMKKNPELEHIIKNIKEIFMEVEEWK